MSKKKIWSNEDIKTIIKFYTEDGLSISYISKNIYHCRYEYIKEILCKNNIKIRNRKSGRVLSPKEEQQVIDLYLNNQLSQKEIADKFNCCIKTIRNTLIRNNIEIKIQPRKNKNINENYFEKIDTEQKAYFLGFIFADDNICKNQLSIEIHFKDRELLKLFKNELHLKSKISYRKRENTEVCCIRVVSKKICEDLKQYGIVPNKTYITKHLPKISEEFIPHFLRGLLDGDGWISIDNSGYYHMGFVSYSKSVCEDFQEYCNSLINQKSKSKITLKDKNGHSYNCQFQGLKIVKQLATVLYKDNKICLERKFRLVEPLFD
jgi:transposase-like protein